jgi:hypothetical protein
VRRIHRLQLGQRLRSRCDFQPVLPQQASCHPCLPTHNRVAGSKSSWRMSDAD